MNQAIVSDKIFTVQEYIEFEETSPIRHEFYKGKLYAMAGTSDSHNDVVNNIVASMRPAFKKKGCRVYSESVKVEIDDDEHYTYPDVFITCHLEDKKSSYIKRYPSLIIEVLSKSTAEYDRTDKFQKYQKVPSIQHYMLVDSRKVFVELFSRSENQKIWSYQSFDKITDVVSFPDLDFSISLEAIYEDINFSLRIANFE